MRSVGLSYLTLIVGKVQGGAYRYVGSIMSSQSEAQVEVTLEEGSYVVYCRAEWRLRDSNRATLSVYSEQPTLLQQSSKKKHPEFLPLTMYDFVKRNDTGKQLLSKSGEDWFCARLLVEECGLGVIVAESKTLKTQVSVVESSFNWAGYTLKHPHKKKGRFSEISEAGKPVIILARVLTEAAPSKLKFPPADTEIKKLASPL